MESPVLTVDNFCAFFGGNQVLHDINMYVQHNRVTALMGPSGCGKTTLLRSINRMHELVPDARVSGTYSAS